MQTETRNKKIILLHIVLVIISSGCITMYDTRLVPLEILEPAKVYFPLNIKKIAIRYNNANIASENSSFGQSFKSKKYKTLFLNDSILSELYFDTFTGLLCENKFFDSVYVLSPGKYSNTQFIYSMPKELENVRDSLPEFNDNQIYIYYLVELLKADNLYVENIFNKKVIDKELGLYNRFNLSDIRDTTEADLLFSFDFFETQTLISNNEKPHNFNFLFFTSIWNIYDLNERQLKYCYFRRDSALIIGELSIGLKNLENLNIEEAAINSAAKLVFDIIPHWVTADRTIYKLIHRDIQDANGYVDKGDWMGAAELWKAGLKSSNHRVTAQCMFNLAVACEVAGDFNAALDWLSKSSKELKHEDEVHRFNCNEYLRILGKRKYEKKLIDFQYNPKIQQVN